MNADLLCGDVLTWASDYDGEPFHALFCDPPYELDFMGKSWDRTGIAFRPETWAALAEHLHPGAFILAFASTRGYHRQAVAMEDAGLTMHPSLFWVTGSSFPKATRVDTQIDAAAGVEREEVGVSRPGRNGTGTGQTMAGGELRNNGRITAPATPLAQAWAGHRYGRQALKNAAEVILVFQKPYRGRPVDCIMETGAGALNIDGARIPANGGSPAAQRRAGSTTCCRPGQYAENQWVNRITPERYQEVRPGEAIGRWPSNFLLTHLPPSECPMCHGTGLVAPDITCPACDGEGAVGGCRQVGEKRVEGRREDTGIQLANTQGSTIVKKSTLRSPFSGYADPDGKETVADWDCEEGCPVRALGEMSGVSKSSGGCGEATRNREKGTSYSWKLGKIWASMGGLGDTGTAARFFHQSDWSLEVQERLAAAVPFSYVAKASRREREMGLAGFDLKDSQKWNEGGIKAHREEHTQEIISQGLDARGRTLFRENGDETLDQRFIPNRMANNHPTVKPLALLRYLSALLLPPAEYGPRRILVPFAGVGSEMIGAALAGWEEVVGIEMEAEYVEIGRARLAYWTGAGDPQTPPSSTQPRLPSRAPDQLSLW